MRLLLKPLILVLLRRGPLSSWFGIVGGKRRVSAVGIAVTCLALGIGVVSTPAPGTGVASLVRVPTLHPPPSRARRPEVD